MHTMWKGSISFGLVNIPIKLFSATEDKDIKLRTLHTACRAPIKYEKVCTNCNQEVSPKEITKGYEYVKGKYAIFSEDELAELKEKNEEKAVEIVDFVKLEEIDPIYFNRSYYMGPGENGAKAYSLLREALRKTGKIGVAHITIRSKKQLAILRVLENSLLMETIHYPDEIKQADHVPAVPENIEINEKELQTAIKLIDELTIPFDPEQYEDTYRVAFLEKIKEKLQKEDPVSPTATPKEDVVDLVSALQASIERTKTGSTRPKKPVPLHQNAEKKKQKTTRKKATGAQ
ncbi:Ku protein [Bacillus gobiensis]|uniref:non-homologous end joining protein Ku n=1 Tax=Bacillus gobiensis TaxID=1441095 RepID=UPI003D1BBFCE